MALHVPDTRLRTATPSGASSLRRRGRRTPQIQAADALHEVTPHSVDSASGGQQARCLRVALLHPKQPDAGVVPHACGALCDNHFGGEDEAPEEGFVPAQ